MIKKFGFFENRKFLDIDESEFFLNVYLNSCVTKFSIMNRVDRPKEECLIIILVVGSKGTVHVLIQLL